MAAMIGLFGGTFDPIHFGHLRTALEVAEELGLEEVRFVPARCPPHRAAPGATAQQRAEMVRLAIAEHPGFVLDPCELDRGGPSYTLDTLVTLGGTEARTLVLILGADAFAGLPTWHRWTELLDHAHIAVMNRPDASLSPQGFPVGWLERALTTDATALRTSPTGRVINLAVTQLAISATAIRARAAVGKSLRYLLPEAVRAFIDYHQIYQPPTSTEN
ncbi:MAG: nicotinate-nucleotide adenylyltransferase [Thiotrichales bacterium]